jgi:nucleoid DNA-binding protein
MSHELIREMSGRLNRSGQEIEKALHAFGSAVNDRLNSEGQAELAGLGQLVQEGGRRSFRASPALASAVNYRWEATGESVSAPAQPVSPIQPEGAVAEEEPKPIRKVSWAPLAGVDPTAPSDLPAAEPPQPQGEPERAPGAESAQPSAREAAAHAEFKPSPAAALDPVSPLVDDLTFETLHPTFPGGASADAPPATSPAAEDLSSAAIPAAASASGTPRSKPAPRGPRPRGGSAPRRADEPGPSRTGLLIGGASIVVLAVIAWIAFGLLGRDGSPASPVSTSVPAITPADSGQVAGATDPGAGLVPADSAATVPVGEGSTPEPVPPSTFDITSSGYTLMVGSSTSLTGATREMAGFRSLGLPVALLSYEDADGELRHRIAVGQFASIPAADSARAAMAARLPAGTWVRRIRR